MLSTLTETVSSVHAAKKPRNASQAQSGVDPIVYATHTFQAAFLRSGCGCGRFAGISRTHPYFSPNWSTRSMAHSMKNSVGTFGQARLNLEPGLEVRRGYAHLRAPSNIGSIAGVEIHQANMNWSKMRMGECRIKGKSVNMSRSRGKHCTLLRSSRSRSPSSTRPRPLRLHHDVISRWPRCPIETSPRRSCPAVRAFPDAEQAVPLKGSAGNFARGGRTIYVKTTMGGNYMNFRRQGWL